MEWSSDGYVLAVGWEHGWAIFSVGGRCLAWGFGVEDAIDEERYVLAVYTILTRTHALTAAIKTSSCMELLI